ncbi:hypothetical protein L226DRAFT_469043 [Lentinus tigrinus ALCF2SS1-7]|uniref:Sodium/calcium exchanger membrane region domain-containing protein n=1 Tax=Lentinus tigrinus ALCF2SS1-6 TaxID=1328759 RepID=A0A5C2S0F5_9APHY|nr:hypothetical protein L227DRAFT_507820 [Lentinus tigrinus ALCF2SS1-6]RPD71171.1 hypothetical protein L226DRAFT_469043 [Lentinus tigrinus ALCF2SS1-7]
MQRLRPSHSPEPTLAEPVQEHSQSAAPQTHGYTAAYGYATDRVQIFWDRLRGKGRRPVSWTTSIRNIVCSSWLNVLFILIPFAWVSHWHKGWGSVTTFALCFLAIIPLEGMFDWGGEQMFLYLGKDLGDLLVVTLNNAVEAVLAIILLRKCDLRLLQATVVGVVILHLLLIPGTAFLVGGSQVRHQTLHPHHTDMNHSLLMIGVLATLLPTAFFAALDRGAAATGATAEAGAETAFTLVSDSTRAEILHISRGLAVILLVIYVASRIYLHNPPGENNALTVPQDAPDAIKHHENELLEEEPLTNPWACMIILVITVAIMAVTAEFLVESIEGVRETSGITEEWFGLILLPFVSFSADGTVAVVFFLETVYDQITGKKIQTPSMLARGRAIDLSIQFTLWWMPFLVLLGWWSTRPMHLLFDFFEVALLLGSCFLVNYITADAKTNWVEGLIMIAFYIMIAVTAWFYPGQPEVEFMLECPGTVAEAVAAGAEGGAEGAVELVRALAARAL